MRKAGKRGSSRLIKLRKPALCLPVGTKPERVGDVDSEPIKGGLTRAGPPPVGRFVQSGRTTFFPVPVLRTSTTGRTITFFPELNEPARPAAARPVSRDAGGQAAGGSAVRQSDEDKIGGNRWIGVHDRSCRGLATAGTS